MGVEVELFDDLDAVERDSDCGLERAAQASLFDRLSWYRLLADHCPSEGKTIVVRARNMSRKAWLFLEVRGSKADARANWYSLRFAPIGAPELFPHLLAPLREGLVARLDLAPLEETAALADACRQAGWIPFVRPQTSNWRARTEGMDFAAYWASRPARLRNTAERKAKAAGLEIEICERFDPGAWADYEAVYRSSWKPEEGSPGFLRALAEQESKAGTLRLGIARKDGDAVAAQLWLVENEEAAIHKLAYREVSKAFSPGTVLSMAMFRHVLDRDRVRLIDYGTGDEPYKADWMDERRTLWRLTAFNRRTLRGLGGAMRAAASSLARRLSGR